jgi:type I site-specific restriction endonuclease
MRRELSNLNADLVREHPEYVCRVVSDEGKIGRGYLSRFQELETDTPAIVTTSQMLTTGVDIPMVKNVAIVRVINSMTEFKQIIGETTTASTTSRSSTTREAPRGSLRIPSSTEAPPSSPRTRSTPRAP